MCAGSVYFYIFIGSKWSRQSKLLAKDGITQDYWGASVSIYNNNAFIGSELDYDKGVEAGMYCILIYVCIIWKCL
jgi:hypothetical protein